MEISHGWSRLLVPFSAPLWCQQIKNIPKVKVKLAQTPSKIHEWLLPGIPIEFSVSIKRDDLTGSSLSGNKVRKLEFLLADAIQKGCSHLITCGSLQSNHCRAAAVAAKELGFTCHLILRAREEDAGCDGNLLLNRMLGSYMYLVDIKERLQPDLTLRMEKLAQSIREKWGEESYIVPLGGSNAVGLFGYIEAFEELLQQDLVKKYDDIVVTCGSGGTVAGLAIANYLAGSELRVHGITVCDDASYFHQIINELLKQLDINNIQSEDIVDIIDGYKGQGYGLSTDEELRFIVSVAQKTGIFLDPVYTGKATRGLIQELQINPGRFKGNQIIFIHTGGIFGLYDGKMSAILKQMKETNLVFHWPDKNLSPLGI